MALTPDAAKRLARDVLGDSVDGERTPPGGDAGEFAPGGTWQLGRYAVIGRLGTGGMGEVFRAVQEHPHREVALKLVRPELISSEARRRFEHEARVLARLQHPGIAQIFDAGEAETDAGPRPYFAMELVEGRPLTVHTADAALGVRAKLGLFLKVCDAVEHAHRKGVVHRDLKPTNILVTATGEPKVLDFGVARMTDSDVQVTTLRTDIGKLIGTIPYMSPEQAAGEAEELDTRSDVYSLGVVLYELLAGRLPYELSKRPIPEAVRVVREEEPAPLSSVSRVYRGDLETIVGKALEKERERRYQSVGELAGDVRRYLSDETIVARPASAVYQIRKFARRNRAVVLSVVMVIGSLAAATTLSAAFAMRERNARIALGAARLAEKEQKLAAVSLAAEADKRRVEAEREAARADTVTDFLQSMISAVGPGEQGRDVTLIQVLDSARSRLITDLDMEPELAAVVLQTLGNLYRDLGRLDDAFAILSQAATILEGMPEPSVRLQSGIRRDIGVVTFFRGDYKLGAELLRAVLAEQTRVLGAADVDTLKSACSLCDVLTHLGELIEAGDLARRTLLAAEDSYGKEASITLDANRRMATVAIGMGNWTEAEAVLVPLLQVYRDTKGKDHPATLSLMKDLALSLRWQDRYVEAKDLLEQTIESSRRVLGESDPMTTSCMNNLAGVIAALGDPEGALAQTSTLARLLIDRDGERHPEAMTAMANEAYLLSALGREDEAEEKLRRAVVLGREVRGPSHPSVWDNSLNLARSLMKLRRYEEALDILQELPTLASEREDDPHVYAGIALHWGGNCLLQMGRLEQAEEQFRATYDWFLSADPPLRDQAIGAAQATGRLYDRAGQPDSALRWREHAATLESDRHAP